MKQGIEWQVSSLEPSQKLKELGVKQDGLFTWNKQNDIWSVWNECEESEFQTSDFTSTVQAFTVAELAEIVVPALYEAEKEHTIDPPEELEIKDDASLVYSPDWLAGMLIYLLENKMITLPNHSPDRPINQERE